MYLAYSDDSKTKHNNVEWQVMSTVMVKDETFRGFELHLGLIAAELLPPEKYEQFAEFHASDLYNGTKAFEGIEWAQRMSILEILLTLLEKEKIPVIYGAVDLSRLNKTIYASANPIEMTFRMCALGVQDWMSKQLQEKFSQYRDHKTPDEQVRFDDVAVFILDDFEGNKPLKSSLQQAFRQMRKPMRPPSFQSESQLEHVLDDMYFGDSKFSVGLQLADACSYFIGKHLGGDATVDRFYARIEPHIVYSQIEPEQEVTA
jgi:hypothetical protein